MLLPLLAALTAALCYGSASVLQAVAAQRSAPRLGLSLRTMLDLARQVPYVAGTLADGVGFVAALVALQRLPLFLVQATIAGSVGVTAVLAWRFLGARLTGRELVALGGLVLGLLLLAVAAQPAPATPLPAYGEWIVLAGVPLVLVEGQVALRAGGRFAAGGVALAAGLAFGGLGVAGRALTVPDPWWHLLADPLTYAVVGYGLIGMLLFAASLQRGAVTTASAITFAVETVLSALIGLAFLGDATRPGLGPVAMAGFLLVLAGAISLARYAEPAT